MPLVGLEIMNKDPRLYMMVPGAQDSPTRLKLNDKIQFVHSVISCNFALPFQKEDLIQIIFETSMYSGKYNRLNGQYDK